MFAKIGTPLIPPAAEFIALQRVWPHQLAGAPGARRRCLCDGTAPTLLPGQATEVQRLRAGAGPRRLGVVPQRSSTFLARIKTATRSNTRQQPAQVSRRHTVSLQAVSGEAPSPRVTTSFTKPYNCRPLRVRSRTFQRGKRVADIAEWEGLVRDRSDGFDGLLMIAPTPGAAAGASWSGPFRAIASDGEDYFVKALDTCPTGQEASLTIEYVVAQVGRLIQAPVCETSLIRIPEEVAGWEPRAGILLQPGIAHASRALEHADEQGRPYLASRLQDDNPRRHVGVYALFDWCCGADPQWLYDIDNDRMIYSHDHGLYLPPAGQGKWTREDLIAHADTPYQLSDPRHDLSLAAIDEVAKALESIDRSTLATVLNSVPSSWPVTDSDLEALGWFLEHRTPAVADRVRNLI